MANPSSVGSSKHRREIVEFLNVGWSAPRIRRYLVERYGDGPEVPGVRAIHRYRNEHIDPTAALPARLITDAMRRLKGSIDEIRELDVLYRAQRERIAMFWASELQTGKPQTQANEAVRIAMEILHRRFQLAQQLGIGRAGEDKRVQMSETRALELPEETFHEFLNLLREQRQGSN